MATRIQSRHDTAANWVTYNPILVIGEIGIETDTNKLKVGDGIRAWSSLPYLGKRGTSVLNFGLTPGTNIATTTVTGQVGILTTSVIRAFLMGSSTDSHNAYEHFIVPLNIRCGNIVANTSFDIVASTELRINGTFLVNWTWE